MDRRTLVEFVTAWFLILGGAILTILPIFNVVNVRLAFIIVISFYGIIHLIKNLLIINSKDYTGFSTSLSSIAILVILFFVDINDNPLNLAMVLFVWIILMSLTKLKESDYYHDKKNKMWQLNITTLILFILTGILTTINLYCTSDIQILILGFFFLINGILDLMDPLVTTIMGGRKIK